MKLHSKIIFGKNPYHPRDAKIKNNKSRRMKPGYYPYESQSFKQVNSDLGGKLSEILSRLNSRKGKRPLVVDLGCGTAKTAAEVAEKHPNVDVLAFSGHYYPEWEAYKHPNLTLFHGSLDELHEKLKEHPADLVYSDLGALPEQTVDNINYIRNFRQYLTPNGQILFFPSKRPPGNDPKFWKRLVNLKKSGYRLGFIDTGYKKRWFSVQRVD